MKKALLLLLSLLLVTICMAQIRVVERSGRQPDWVNGIQKNYIIVSGSGPTIQEAQQNALNTVKERIVSSVAENVRTRSEMSVQEVSGTHVSSFLEKFATTTTTEAAQVPFLQGISLSKVEEFYWEKTENRDTRAVRFNYHLKYPFSEVELFRLVSEFQKRDRELTEQLEGLLERVNSVASVEEIEKSIGELHILQDYFMDGRRDQAALGITRYRSLLGSIELVELQSDLGELKFALRLGGRFITTTRRPTVRSECARITSTVSNPDHTTIQYDYEYCFEDPENHIEVTYRFGNATVRKPFFFDITADKAAIFVSEPFRFTGQSQDGSTVRGGEVDITLVSKYQAPFTINRVVLEWPGHPPVMIDQVGRRFAGRGNHTLRLPIEQALQVAPTTSSGRSVAMLSGLIHFTSDKTGEQKTYRILNHSYTTSW